MYDMAGDTAAILQVIISLFDILGWSSVTIIYDEQHSAGNALYASTCFTVAPLIFPFQEINTSPSRQHGGQNKNIYLILD